MWVYSISDICLRRGSSGELDLGEAHHPTNPSDLHLSTFSLIYFASLLPVLCARMCILISLFYSFSTLTLSFYSVCLSLSFFIYVSLSLYPRIFLSSSSFFFFNFFRLSLDALRKPAEHFR